MDIFKFNNPNQQTLMESGEIINGLKSKMWLEKYRDAGEFRLVADLSSGLREKLPIGTFVSHPDTYEIMIVENHEIAYDQDKESEIIVSGRTFETYLENRVTGVNRTFPTSGGAFQSFMAAGSSAGQAVTVIKNHIDVSTTPSIPNYIPNLDVINETTGLAVQNYTYIDMGNLYEKVMDFLTIDNLGIKTIRPGVWNGRTDTVISIHFGQDKSGTVIFSTDTGEIVSADYLWSSKKYKTAVVVTGKWVGVFVVMPGADNYARRTMHITSTLDQEYSTAPTGTALTDIINYMTRRGWQALAQQVDVALAKVELSKEFTAAKYRVDYNIGDLVWVRGDYNENRKMRVVEHVEIEDENGMQSYPTLADPSGTG